MLALQLPEFTKSHPELSICKLGTINVRLNKPLRVDKPDFVIGPLRYRTQSGDLYETYGFVRIQLEVPPGSTTQQAWIYIPEKSPHRDNLFQVEIISAQIDAVAYGIMCRLTIERDFRTEGINMV
jgi:hypothetical protein